MLLADDDVVVVAADCEPSLSESSSTEHAASPSDRARTEAPATRTASRDVDRDVLIFSNSSFSFVEQTSPHNVIFEFSEASSEDLLHGVLSRVSIVRA